ncbi:MAG TPA: malate synthase A, partial [Stenotrophomonas sp.]|nr:malate synthase A [Stenotrophomonas sp.]
MSAVAYATAQPTPADAPATPGIALTTQLAGQSALLPAGVLALLVSLHRAVEPERQRRLQARVARQAFFDGGGLPDFRADTAEIRAGDWHVAPLPEALQDRRVEITGPTDPKMVINALNSGAKVFMADFEDSTAPAWRNLLAGQQALIGAVRGDLTYTGPSIDGKPGKQYTLRPFNEQAVLIVRPRGW